MIAQSGGGGWDSSLDICSEYSVNCNVDLSSRIIGNKSVPLVEHTHANLHYRAGTFCAWNYSIVKETRVKFTQMLAMTDITPKENAPLIRALKLIHVKRYPVQSLRLHLEFMLGSMRAFCMSSSTRKSYPSNHLMVFDFTAHRAVFYMLSST